MLLEPVVYGWLLSSFLLWQRRQDFLGGFLPCMDVFISTYIYYIILNTMRVRTLKQLFKFAAINKPSQITSKIDAYRAIHLNIQSPMPQNQFSTYLSSLMQEQLQGNQSKAFGEETTAIWVYLKPSQFKFADYLYGMGFAIHHGLADKLVMSKWISKQKNLIPHYSNSYISCGALLIKDDRVFLVQEKNGLRQGLFGVPGGRADPGETINSCVQRQLLQQTNIRAKFNYILHFRELQLTSYGGMDYYFVCVMNHNNDSFANMRLCPRELSNYKWVHLSEYEQFCKEYSMGSQYQLAKYVSQLHKQGFDFNNRKVNQIKTDKYKSKLDGVERMVVQHGMVEGIGIRDIL